MCLAGRHARRPLKADPPSQPHSHAGSWFLNYLLRMKLLGTVQTDSPKVMSVTNVSRSDHGSITARDDDHRRRSSARLRDSGISQLRRVAVSHLTRNL